MEIDASHAGKLALPDASKQEPVRALHQDSKYQMDVARRRSVFVILHCGERGHRRRRAWLNAVPAVPGIAGWLARRWDRPLSGSDRADGVGTKGGRGWIYDEGHRLDGAAPEHRGWQPDRRR